MKLAPKNYVGYTLHWTFKGGKDKCKILSNNITAYDIIYDNELPSLCPPITILLTTYPSYAGTYTAKQIYLHQDIMNYLPNCHSAVDSKNIIRPSTDATAKTMITTSKPTITKGKVVL